MFKKKFLDFLIENNIDKDLMILDDKEEEMNFKVAISNSIIINTKTLMPVKKSHMKFESGDIIFYLKQNNNNIDNIVLYDICSRFPDSRINIHVCKRCSLSTMNLCVYNNIHKHDCILTKKKRE